MTLKFTLIAAVLLFSLSSLCAQDTIRLKNGLMLHGLITEVNGKEIKFRVDGGSVSLDQVLSYQKNGTAVAVQTPPPPVANNKPVAQPDCEKKNVGDVEFTNKTETSVTVYIYAIAIPPDGTITSSNNPMVAEILIPAMSSKTAYELTHGIHYISYIFKPGISFGSQPSNGSGQVKITRCSTGTFDLK